MILFVIFQTKRGVEADDGNVKLANLTLYWTYRLNEECWISYALHMQ